MNETLLGIIIGGGITLLATVITSLWNQKIHETNIKEEREKIKEEREFIAKRESLLITIDAVRKYYFYYISLPDRTLPTEGKFDIEPKDLDLALSRLDVFCSLETIQKASLLSQVATKITHEAIKAKLPSGFLNEKIKVIEDSITLNETLTKTYQEEINSLSASHSDIDRKNVLGENISENMSENIKYCDEKNELIKEKWVQTENCRQLVIDNIGMFNKASRELLLLARKELSFPLEEVKYRQIKEQLEDANAQSLNNLMNHIHGEIDNFIKEIESGNSDD